MVFDPKLSAEFSFTRPSEAPTAIGAIESLFSFGASNIGKSSGSTGGSLTADEKFSIDLAEYVKNQPPSWKLDSKSMRDFIRTHPQHTSAMSSYAEELGVVTKPMVEIARDTGVDAFLKTPEGALTANMASKAGSEEEANAIILGGWQKQAELDAQIVAMEREKKAGDTQASVDNQRWDAIGEYQRDFTNGIISEVLSPVVSSVMNGNSYKLTPEEQAQLGVRYSEININNLPAVLQDARAMLVKQNSMTFSSKYGYTPAMPPKEWEDRVLGGLDSLIDVSKQIDSPQERASAIGALLESKAYEKLDAAGFGLAAYAMKNFPPQLTTTLLTNADAMNTMGSILFTPDGAVATGETIRKGINDLSKKEAEDIMNTVLKTGAQDPTMFAVLKETQKKSGYGVVDGPTWKSILGKDTSWIKTNAEKDPNFRQEFADWAASDLSQTIEVIRRELGPGVELMFQNGKFTIIPTPEGMRLQEIGKALSYSGINLGDIAGIDIVKDSQRNLPEGLGVEDLNQKLASMGLVGSVGKEVMDAIIFQELGASPDSIKKGGSGSSGSSGSLTMANVATPTPATNINHDWVVNGLVGRGMPEHIAIGFAMNFKDESAFNPGIIGDNGAALGLAQWNGHRKRALESFANARGLPASDPNVQLDYLISELGGPQSAAWQKIVTAKTPQEAAVLILEEFEKPAKVHMDKRRAAYLGSSHDPSVSLSYGYAGADTSAAGLSNFDPTGAVAVGQGEQAIASGAPERASTASTPVQATPVAQDTEKAPQRLSDGLLERAREILAARPMDQDVKALIEALIGGQ